MAIGDYYFGADPGLLGQQTQLAYGTSPEGSAENQAAIGANAQKYAADQQYQASIKEQQNQMALLKQQQAYKTGLVNKVLGLYGSAQQRPANILAAPNMPAAPAAPGIRGNYQPQAQASASAPSSSANLTPGEASLPSYLQDAIRHGGDPFAAITTTHPTSDQAGIIGDLSALRSSGYQPSASSMPAGPAAPGTASFGAGYSSGGRLSPLVLALLGQMHGGA